MGFQDVKRPLRTKSAKRPIKVGKRPINEGKPPIKAKVLVGVSVGSLMGCFRAPLTWRKTAPLKRPIKRSMIYIFQKHRNFQNAISRSLNGISQLEQCENTWGIFIHPPPPPQISRKQKTRNINIILGLSREQVGVKNVYEVLLVLRKTETKKTRKSQKNVGTILGQSWENPGKIPWKYS